jgi:hypothetical protein
VNIDHFGGKAQCNKQDYFTDRIICHKNDALLDTQEIQEDRLERDKELINGKLQEKKIAVSRKFPLETGH